MEPHDDNFQQTVRNPLEFFELFFDEDIVQHFVYHSNLYASQRNVTLNLTDNECRGFIAILLLSGYLRLPRRHMYWENKCDLLLDCVQYNATKSL